MVWNLKLGFRKTVQIVKHIRNQCVIHIQLWHLLSKSLEFSFSKFYQKKI